MPTANQDQSQEVVVENLVRYKVQSQVNLKNISDLFCSFPANNGNYDNISNAKTRLEGIFHPCKCDFDYLGKYPTNKCARNPPLLMNCRLYNDFHIRFSLAC